MGISWSRPALMDVLCVAPQSLMTQPLHSVFQPLLGLGLEESKDTKSTCGPKMCNQLIIQQYTVWFIRDRL